jgi:hypothetical protein
MRPPEVIRVHVALRQGRNARSKFVLDRGSGPDSTPSRWWRSEICAGLMQDSGKVLKQSETLVRTDTTRRLHATSESGPKLF